MNEDETFKKLTIGHIPARLGEISKELENLDHSIDIEKLMLETRELMQRMAEVDFPNLESDDE